MYENEDYYKNKNSTQYENILKSENINHQKSNENVDNGQ